MSEGDTFEQQWEQWSPRFAMDVEARRKAEEIRAIEHGLIDKMDRYLISPRVVDPDASTGALLHEAYMALKTPENLEQISYRPEADAMREDGTLEVKALLDTLIAYNSEVEFQTQVVRAAAELVYYKNHPEVGFSESFLSDAKKASQAELLVLYGHPFGSPWQKFFDEVVPGVGLKQGNPDDDRMIEEEWDRLAEFDSKRMEQVQSIHEVREALGVSLRHQPETLVQLTAILLGVQAIALAHVKKGLTDPEQRNKEIRSYAEELGIKDDEYSSPVVTIINFFDHKHPLGV